MSEEGVEISQEQKKLNWQERQKVKSQTSVGLLTDY